MKNSPFEFAYFFICGIVCFAGTALHVSQMLNKTWEPNGLNFILFIVCSMGSIASALGIKKNIKR